MSVNFIHNSSKRFHTDLSIKRKKNFNPHVEKKETRGSRNTFELRIRYKRYLHNSSKCFDRTVPKKNAVYCFKIILLPGVHVLCVCYLKTQMNNIVVPLFQWATDFKILVLNYHDLEINA